MKSIELTEDHKSKLLEMCEKLFITYKYHSIWNNDVVLGAVKRKTPFCESDEFLEGLISIHWFEFCITKLSVKILCQNKHMVESSYSKNYFLQNKIINSDEHIVNYLYKEFKKLK